MSTKIQRVGDPHLGREFKTNVPLHRRGERERLQRAAFRQEMTPGKHVDMVVCMGDLFDKPQVSYETIWLAHGIISDLASNHPDVKFVFLQGNHDESRDLNEITAWKLFTVLVAHRPNIICVTDPWQVKGVLFLPWSPRYTAEQMLELALQDKTQRFKPHTAYGHWDLDKRSSSWNLIPLQGLAKAGITTVYTGHIHLPSVYTERGVEVNVVGSLQPYAHGEDGGQGEVRYLTVTAEDWEADQFRFGEEVYVRPDEKWSLLSNCCIRILRKKDDPVPLPIDCLQWSVETVEEGEDGTEFGVELTLDGFSMDGTYIEVMNEAPSMLPAIREKIDARWKQIFNENS